MRSPPSVFLQLKCSFVALTGRGVISLIQAVAGVIFSIEGFWGAVKFDAPTTKRFLIFLVVYFFVSITIAIINLETLNDYCSTAVSESDAQSCFDTARLYSYLLLGVTLGLVVRRRPHTAHGDDDPAGRGCSSTRTDFLLSFVSFLRRPLPLLSLQPVIFAVGVVFYLAIQSNEASFTRRRNGNQSSAYEMADIVDRMGFSTD